ncbi:copper transport protein ATOX1 isoform X1 [Cavia porcellus]|uniref:copper transport protein ATOX1 isoform X1 n=1 Tax=Cavia porcellus TaxID=10141 RepID=UPI002FE15130
MPKHEFSVDMTCEGCADAVARVLNKLGGLGRGLQPTSASLCCGSFTSHIVSSGVQGLAPEDRCADIPFPLEGLGTPALELGVQGQFWFLFQQHWGLSPGPWH